ncbi:MAG: uroporphyrinogen-III synthase [Chloroflexia bacterium]
MRATRPPRLRRWRQAHTDDPSRRAGVGAVAADRATGGRRSSSQQFASSRRPTGRPWTPRSATWQSSNGWCSRAPTGCAPGSTGRRSSGWRRRAAARSGRRRWGGDRSRVGGDGRDGLPRACEVRRGVAAGCAARSWSRGSAVPPAAGRRARRTLADGLRAAGAIVHTVSVYTTEPSREDAQELREALRSGALDAATFTSASTVRNLVAALAPESAAQLLSVTVVACIGPITAATAREHGVRVDVEASEHTLHGLVAALAARLEPVGDAGPNPAQDDGRTPTTCADSSGGRTAS